MIESSTLISDVQSEFEGGTSLSVDWDSMIRRAIENVLDNCRPETLKRTVPLYGGLSQNLYAYYCPEDVLVPSDIFTNDRQRKFTYQPARTFYTRNEFNKYTIEYINSKRFIIIRHDVTSSIQEIDSMDSVGTKTGGTPTLNEHNYLFGAAAVEATFNDTGTVEFGDTFATPIDITEYLRGVVIVPVYIANAANITSLQLRLKTDDSNYHRVISTADSIGNYFTDGWNFIRFNMATRTEVATPVDTNITKWSIIADTVSGNETLIFDKLTLQKFAPYYFQYYSNRAYIDGSTGALWKQNMESAIDDKINLDRDLAGVLHYEMCIIVHAAASFNAVDGQTEKTFEKQLSRKWANYYATHPSDEAPLTYSKSPEIDINNDLDFSTSNSTESFIE